MFKWNVRVLYGAGYMSTVQPCLRQSSFCYKQEAQLHGSWPGLQRWCLHTDDPAMRLRICDPVQDGTFMQNYRCFRLRLTGMRAAAYHQQNADVQSGAPKVGMPSLYPSNQRSRHLLAPQSQFVCGHTSIVDLPRSLSLRKHFPATFGNRNVISAAEGRIPVDGRSVGNNGMSAFQRCLDGVDERALGIQVACPLFERPPVHVASVERLLGWFQKACSMAKAVSDSFADADDGPTTQELLREIEWVLDDAVSAVGFVPSYATSDNSIASNRAGAQRSLTINAHAEEVEWHNCSWEELKRKLEWEFAVCVSLSAESKRHVVERDPKTASVISEHHGLTEHKRKHRLSTPQSSQQLASSPWPAQVTAAVLKHGGEDGVAKRDTVANSRDWLLVLLRESVDWMDFMWARRIQERLPFQYMVGAAHWRDLVLAVQPGVLIPRPETEQLVDLVQAAVESNASLMDHPWADMGTGSGAIAIGLARLRPGGRLVYAVDCSPEAIAVAVCNVWRYGLLDSVDVCLGGWFAPLQGLEGKLGVVVSNPPYIPTENLPSLQAEVRQHEPACALDGGEQNGINSLMEVCRGAAKMLRPGGFLALETNGGQQAEDLASFLSSCSEGWWNEHYKHIKDGPISDTGRVSSLSDAVNSNEKCPSNQRLNGNRRWNHRPSSGEQNAAPSGEQWSKKCFRDVRIVKDLANVSRFVVAYRSH